MKKVRWGILSTARIGIQKVIPAMQQSKICEIVAIASRDLKKAKNRADQLGIPRAFGSYEALLSDPNIDAVYNPLPNHLHVPWSIKAIRAGKHVLCEKPVALSSTEAETLLTVSREYPGVKVMEAFMYRFHPQWQYAREMVHNGRLGTIKTISAFFSYYNMDPANIRNKAKIGGGGLMDIGCYCISLSRFIFNGEPRRVAAKIFYDPKFKTDYLTSVLMEFRKGTAIFTCSTQLAPYQRVNIVGTAGQIEIEIPFNAPSDKPCRIYYQDERGLKQKSFKICNQYTIQGDLFSKAILENTDVPTPLEDAFANMRIIEAIIKSDKSHGWSRI
jgi:predicted dehydrogenase